MKKKVFFIMSTDDFSGAEAVNFSIIDGLKDKYDFYWVSKKGNINNFLKERNIKWIEINKLSVKEIKRIVKDNKPDILHATDFKASVICALANTKVKLIEHLHNNSPWLKKISTNSFAFLFAALRADRILTVSESIEKEYIFSKLVKSKIVCIDNPVFRKKILDNVKKDDYKKEFDICCLGRITEAKDPIRFANIIYEAKKFYPNIKVIWIGDGELRERFEDEIHELNLDNNIILVGNKKNPYPFLAMSKIFVLSSKWEGYGLAVFEALTLGLPCIVSNVGGLPKLVDNSCGKVCNDNLEFVSMILKLLNDKELYRTRSINSQIKSKKLENYNSYIKQIDLIYSYTYK